MLLSSTKANEWKTIVIEEEFDEAICVKIFHKEEKEEKRLVIGRAEWTTNVIYLIRDGKHIASHYYNDDGRILWTVDGEHFVISWDTRHITSKPEPNGFYKIVISNRRIKTKRFSTMILPSGFSSRASGRLKELPKNWRE